MKYYIRIRINQELITHATFTVPVELHLTITSPKKLIQPARGIEAKLVSAITEVMKRHKALTLSPTEHEYFEETKVVVLKVERSDAIHSLHSDLTTKLAPFFGPFDGKWDHLPTPYITLKKEVVKSSGKRIAGRLDAQLKSQPIPRLQVREIELCKKKTGSNDPWHVVATFALIED